MTDLQRLTLRLAYIHGIVTYEEYRRIFCVRQTEEKQEIDHRFALQASASEDEK